MKLLKFSQDEARLRIESQDDLWQLSQLIAPGDAVRARTPRKVKATEEAQAERQFVTLTVTAEKVDLTGEQLRIGGPILEGTEDIPKGGWHTIGLGPGDECTWRRPHWPGYLVQRLKELCATKPPKLLLVVFDREEAWIAKVTRDGYDVLTHLAGDVSRKRMAEKPKSDFWAELLKALKEYNARLEPERVILASPSFWKEEFLKTATDPVLRAKFVLATCSSADETALAEALRRDEVRAALEQARVAEELKAIEEVMAEIGKRGKVAYGLATVESAAQAGAITRVLVTDGLIAKARREGVGQRLEAVLESADRAKGKVSIIASSHPGGKRLDGIGGIAALLRYRLEE
jgi:protein pelota